MDHKVLCIDDESHNLEALERLLRKKYKVVTADSGAAALKELENHSFSLIISDQKMPEMTGVEFFMKAIEKQPEAIRILLTGYTDLESVISAINQGQIYRYITKPWEPEEFLGIVRQGIEVFEMKNTIAQQNAELQKANEELKSLDKMKSDFMVLVNHELKTPLTGIFSFVQLLSEEKLSSEQKLYLGKISKNTQRLQDLINDTLLITRIQTDKSARDKVELDISKLILDQWATFAENFKSKNLNLKMASMESFPQVANEKYVSIVLKKALHNCFSHAAPDSEVEVTLKDDSAFWTLLIHNKMSKNLEKTPEELLTAFSTSENILNHSGGTGLGLAVVQAIVNLFKGQVRIQSENLDFQLELKFPKSE